MLIRLLLGLVKGGIVGAAAAFGLHALGLTSGLFAYLSCAAVGAVVGLVAGQAPWRADTIWTPVLKMLVGAAIGAGLCAAGMKAIPEINIASGLTTHSAPILAGLTGLLYGMFVEIDDGGPKKTEATAPAPPSKKK
jgi:hypothetical protein